jgi:glycine oxidase
VFPTPFPSRGKGSSSLNGRTLIIGAGVAGLGTAFELGHRAHPVTVLDRGEVGSESSWAGAGILAPLPPWAYGEAVNRLALAGMTSWPAWVNVLADVAQTDPEYWACGMAVLDEPNPWLAAQWCREHKLRCEGGEQAPDALSASLKLRALWLPDVAQLRNPRLVRALAEAIEHQGGQVLAHTPACGLVARDRRIGAILTPQGELHVDQVVLATGAWGGMNLGPLRGLPAIRPVRGQMLLFAPGSHSLATVLSCNGLYLVPRRDGHLLVGSTLEDAGFDSSTVPKLLNALHQSACELIPSLRDHQPIKSWAGLRPGSPDNIPLIDRHPDFDNLWLNVGHYRYGVTMAPASAALLVDLMEGRKPTLDPTPYSWTAFNQRAWTADNLPGQA